MFSRIAIGGLIATGLALAQAGCTSDPDPIYRQALHIECSHVGGILGDLACIGRPAARENEVVSRYCYATIGGANCFDRPDPDRKNQALGSSGY